MRVDAIVDEQGAVQTVIRALEYKFGPDLVARAFFLNRWAEEGESELSVGLRGHLIVVGHELSHRLDEIDGAIREVIELGRDEDLREHQERLLRLAHTLTRISVELRGIEEVTSDFAWRLRHGSAEESGTP